MKYKWQRTGLKLSIAILFINLLTACESSSPTVETPQSTPKMVQLKEENNRSQITLNSGDSLQIVLAGNPTTGFTWEIAECNQSLLQSQGEVEYQQEQSQLAGRGGIFKFTFKAISAGETTLKLIYHRTFEKEVPPAQEYEVFVKIK